MLTAEENESLTNVVPDTPLVRVKLLGESLVLYRDMGASSV